jgi:hypothetical protein
MSVRGWSTTLVLLALLAPAAAGAQGLEGRFSIAVQAGTQSELGGDLLKGATGTLVGQAAVLETQRYRDVYAPDLRLGGLLGYGVGERTEIIVRGTWYEAEATAVEAGRSGDLPLFAQFGPCEEVGVEAGLRFYIAASGRLKSYVAPVVGARFQKEVLASFSIPDSGFALLNVPFSQEGWVPVFGLDLGFTFDLGERVFVGLDTSLRYQGAPEPFAGVPGLPGAEESSGRWTAPVAAVLGVRF